MTIPVIAFFNNKGGVGKTSLVFHLAWKYADLGYRVVAVDLDPQSNLSAAFLEEDRLEELWPEGKHPETIFGAVNPLISGIGDVAVPHLEGISEGGGQVEQLSLGLYEDRLTLVVGDLELSRFEDELADAWSKCLGGSERAFRVMSAFWRTAQRAAELRSADLILLDLGPNLGAINRAALIAADFVVFPLSADLFSLQGLRNLGPTLRRWRSEWKQRLGQSLARDLDLPAGRMEPVGYVVQQHSVRFDRPVKAYDRWIAQIPEVYRNAVLDEPGAINGGIEDDPYCLILLKHYRSLMPLAQEARKPIFHLKPADGAIGSHIEAVKSVSSDFTRLAQNIAERTGLRKPA
ncbi:MAG TPA: AAA family ATPase [Thermoanaerobaculia bacterium]|nr:AAA family ATPase [Thermoanaerobaculia bacterium]